MAIPREQNAASAARSATGQPGSSRARFAPLGALPPAGERCLDASTPRALLRIRGAREEARRLLCARLGAAAVQLHASGRDALRATLRALAERSGRDEVLVPGYTCFSVAAAAVAAGLRVRLVDVTPEGRIDPGALARAPLERAAALVACNLFGIPEPLAPLRAALGPARVELIDDAAQAFGAAHPEGPVGGRGVPAVLSFGRGKPLSSLGGGAVAWPGAAHGAEPAAPEPAGLDPWRALLRLAAQELALTPLAFRALSAIPALQIGVTRFDPGFSRGPLDGASALLLVHALQRDAAASEGRRRHAEALARSIRASSAWRPLLAEPGVRGVYPRLGLLAPNAGARDRALAPLRALGAGASPLYPSALCDVAALRPHLAGEPLTPGARELAARILTLPSHGRLLGARLEQTLAVLAGAAQ